MRLSTAPWLPRAVVGAAVAAALVPTAGCTDRSGGAIDHDEGRDHRVAGAADAAAPAVGRGSAGSPVAEGPSAVPAAPTTSGAAAVLRRWDRARAAAFASGDPAALSDLYVPGSAAGRRDVRTLRAYLERGLRVEGMRMQLLAVEVLEERRGRLRLEVTDRLTGAVAVGPRGRLRLPSDTASTRLVELVRDEGRWRVAEVSDPDPRPAGP